MLTFTDLITVRVGHGKTFLGVFWFLFFFFDIASHAMAVVCFAVEQCDQAKVDWLFLFQFVFEGMLFGRCAELMTCPDVGNELTLTQRWTPVFTPAMKDRD